MGAGQVSVDIESVVVGAGVVGLGVHMTLDLGGQARFGPGQSVRH
jgi:hypothetical protein